MSMLVLQEKVQINQARRKLAEKGVSCVDSFCKSLLRRFKLISAVPIGDTLKSWDVLLSLDLLEEKVGKNEPILDIGCYASELIVALHKLGYFDLTGADLNPRLTKMPYHDLIHYEITDFLHTKFVDASFKAITAISVIEHGFNAPSLLKEVSRLLKPGGYFIASFDYYPEKIDTQGIEYFNMDWKIFSKDEVADFINQAAGCGLFPLGAMMYDAKDRPIDCGGKQYTFAWLTLTKSK
ncbi:MAG: class I SAM-dependent methyltransferase [Candidatus Omnitrophota bacterium]